jgi:hypothetical protein
MRVSCNASCELRTPPDQPDLLGLCMVFVRRDGLERHGIARPTCALLGCGRSETSVCICEEYVVHVAMRHVKLSIRYQGSDVVGGSMCRDRECMRAYAYSEGRTTSHV